VPLLVIVPERAHPSEEVPFQGFDLDDVCAVVGKDL